MYSFNSSTSVSSNTFAVSIEKTLLSIASVIHIIFPGLFGLSLIKPILLDPTASLYKLASSSIFVLVLILPALLYFLATKLLYSSPMIAGIVTLIASILCLLGYNLITFGIGLLTGFSLIKKSS